MKDNVILIEMLDKAIDSNKVMMPKEGFACFCGGLDVWEYSDALEFANSLGEEGENIRKKLLALAAEIVRIAKGGF